MTEPKAQIVWLIYDTQYIGAWELLHIASSEEKAKQWLRDNTDATERAKPNFWACWEIEAHAVDQ